MTSTSVFAPAAVSNIADIDGVCQAAVAAGLKYQGRLDLLLVTFTEATTIAGVFTRSTTAAAPVQWSRECLKGGRVRALVVNSGNANAFTGYAGKQTVRKTAAATASAFGCCETEVFIASTGVIGEPLEVDKIIVHLDDLLTTRPNSRMLDAASAIMTTDTYPKLSHRQTTIDGVPVRIAGYAKGSGMIQPDMATMLGFLYTDAKISTTVLQTLLNEAMRTSFNAITVDGDTSTSDSVFLAATGQADNPQPASAEDPRLIDFMAALNDICLDLALQVVKDGEGISHLIKVSVSGARNDEDARQVAFSIGNSPLVKTAIAGCDANWGRVVMAVGKSAAKVDQDRLSVRFGDVQLASSGQPVHYNVEEVNALMKSPEIEISVDLGLDEGKFVVWASDLTHGYVSINADYRS